MKWANTIEPETMENPRESRRWTAASLFARTGRGHEKMPPVGRRPLELADIQGLILRGYRMPMVRHFLLGVGDPAAARKLLGRSIGGHETDTPQITTAQDWHVGFARAARRSGRDRRAASRTIALMSASPGQAYCAGREGSRSRFLQVLGAFISGAADARS